MRSWQYMGFNAAASVILSETVKVGTTVVVELDLNGQLTNTYTQNKMENAYTKEVYATESPWYEVTHELYTYTFRDGRVLEDYVQAEPWSSGPCTFMALRDAITKESIAETLWTDKEINNA